MLCEKISNGKIYKYIKKKKYSEQINEIINENNNQRTIGPVLLT